MHATPLEPQPEPAPKAWSISGPRLAAGCGALSFLLALLLRGRTHPDEIFQYLEPAFRQVHGFGLQAWEWRDGIRNWFAPGLIALVLRGLKLAHLDGLDADLAAVWALGAAGHALGMLALYRIIERRSGRVAAAIGTALLGTWLSYVVYAPRTLADALTLPPLLWAVWHTLRARDEGRLASGLLAGLCLGLAVVLRTPSLVFAMPLGASLLWNRRWRAAVAMVLGAALVALALGLLDLFTWGSFLHSVRAYVEFNRPGGPVAQRFGWEPWWWYVLPLGGMVPLVIVPAFVLGLRKADLLAGCWFTYLGALELSAHKEARFLLPLLPLGMAIAAGPLAEQLARWVWPSRKRTVALALAWLAMSFASARWQWRVPLDRDLLDAEAQSGRDPELQGLLVTTAGQFGDGGYFHLRRDVPLAVGMPILENRKRITALEFSHVLVDGDRYDGELGRAGYRRWRQIGQITIWKR